MADATVTLNPLTTHSAVEALIADAHAARVGFSLKPDGNLRFLTVEDMASKPEMTTAHRAFRRKWQGIAEHLSFADVAMQIIEGSPRPLRIA